MGTLRRDRFLACLRVLGLILGIIGFFAVCPASCTSNSIVYKRLLSIFVRVIGSRIRRLSFLGSP